MPRSFCVYILASRSRTLYVGITNNLKRRLTEHLEGEVPGFTKQYRIHRLVHFEQYDNPANAIAREKEIKGWRREKKVALIERTNPTWDDLSLHP
jgi:putative endonuclease